jgi:hypothetical protein
MLNKLRPKNTASKKYVVKVGNLISFVFLKFE